jgi:hypothetical protein
VRAVYSRFHTQVGTIHRRAIDPLAHHNGTSAYSTSLTCHLPAPTIGCLHSNDSLTTLFYVSRSPISIEISVYCCVRNYSVCLHCYVETSVNIVIRKYCRVSKETCNNMLFYCLVCWYYLSCVCFLFCMVAFYFFCSFLLYCMFVLLFVFFLSSVFFVLVY